MSHHVRDKLVALGSALSFVLADWERALLQDLVSAEVIGQSRLQTVETMMLLERLEPHRKALDTLQTMPGINRATAASILVETGPDIYAPPSSKPPMPPQKTGNCQFAGFTRSIAARRGRKRALVATAHKMARILYVVLRDLAPYRDPDTDYEA